MNDLNLFGQIALATTSSLLANGIVHPLSTIKTNLQMGRGAKVPMRNLYKGYWAIFGVDTGAFSVAYATNGWLAGKSPLVAAVAAGVLCAPVGAVGEAFMANRQVHGLPYSAVWRQALKPMGLVFTILREVPFSMALFYISPQLQERAKLNSTVAGFAAGAFSGFVTAPADLIKTRIQASSMSLEVCAKGGFFGGAGTRAVYVGLATAIMNVINQTAPAHAPAALKTLSR